MFVVPMSRRSSPLARRFDRLFDGHFDRCLVPALAADADAARSPALDVSESEGSYTVKLDMPGVAKEDVKVSIEGRRVTIEAQSTKADEKTEGERIVYRERSVSSYARSFTLAAEVDQTSSVAKLDNGVLTLSLQKRHQPSSTRISVN